jgi:hypothetical protein
MVENARNESGACQSIGRPSTEGCASRRTITILVQDRLSRDLRKRLPMSVSGTIRRRSSWHFSLAMSLGVLILALAGAVAPAWGQGLAGYSPLFSFPRLEGEFKLAPIWMGIDQGKNSVSAAGKTLDLKRDFLMINHYWFLDVSGRLQTGPLGLRFQCEPRDFVGVTASRNHPYAAAEARLEFTGLRVGADVDLFRRYKSRAGLNVDYYAYVPIFTEAIFTVNPVSDENGKVVIAAGKKLQGESPVTIGAHASYSPMRDFYGWAPMVDVRVSWPWKAFSSTNLWDLEVTVGMRTVPTALGTMAVKGGYRHTELSFKDKQRFNGVAGTSDLDVTLSGWFAELAYYY